MKTKSATIAFSYIRLLSSSSLFLVVLSFFIAAAILQLIGWRNPAILLWPFFTQMGEKFVRLVFKKSTS